jgi:hypothetical protein
MKEMNEWMNDSLGMINICNKIFLFFSKKMLPFEHFSAQKETGTQHNW